MRYENCPICGSKKYHYKSWSEEYWGTVEQHGLCNYCGYIIEQAYSQPVSGFLPPIKRGFRKQDGSFVEKDIRRRKRLKRKYKIKYGNDDWKLTYI